MEGVTRLLDEALSRVARLPTEEGQAELVDDEEFDRRLDARLTEIGRRFGLSRHVGARARVPGADVPAAGATGLPG